MDKINIITIKQSAAELLINFKNNMNNIDYIDELKCGQEDIPEDELVINEYKKVEDIATKMFDYQIKDWKQEVLGNLLVKYTELDAATHTLIEDDFKAIIGLIMYD